MDYQTRRLMGNGTMELDTAERESNRGTWAASLAASKPAFQRRVNKITRAVRRILNNPADVEDIVQQTFLKALAHINAFRGEASPDTWLTRIAINEALMQLRRSRSTKFVPLEQPSSAGGDRTIELQLADSRPGPEENLSQKEVRVLVSDALKSLSPGNRAVLTMHYADGLSCCETASRLGLTVGATKSPLLRPRKQIAPALRSRLCDGQTEWGKLMLSQCSAVEDRRSSGRSDRSRSECSTRKAD